MSVTNMSPEVAMSELWKQGDAYLRSAVFLGCALEITEPEVGLSRLTDTEDGLLTVARIGDDLDIEATTSERRGSDIIPVTFRLEWGWDIRDLPRVYREDWKGNQVRRVRTLPRREFGRVATIVSVMLAEAESSLG